MDVSDWSQIIVAISAVAIATGSLILQQRHNRKSVEPRLIFDYNLSGENGWHVSIGNVGLGAAIITSAKIQYLGEEFNLQSATSMFELHKRLFGSLKLSADSIGLATVEVISSGTVKQCIKVNSYVAASELIKILWHFVNNLSLSVEFESLYDVTQSYSHQGDAYQREKQM